MYCILNWRACSRKFFQWIRFMNFKMYLNWVFVYLNIEMSMYKMDGWKKNFSFKGVVQALKVMRALTRNRILFYGLTMLKRFLCNNFVYFNIIFLQFYMIVCRVQKTKQKTTEPLLATGLSQPSWFLASAHVLAEKNWARQLSCKKNHNVSASQIKVALCLFYVCFIHTVYFISQ